MKTTRYRALAAALAAIMAVSASACAANTAQTNPIPESDVSVSDENSAAESTESGTTESTDSEATESTATESAVSDAESKTESNESKGSAESKTESKPETTEKQDDKPATTPANSDPAATPESTKPVTTKAATTKAATTKATTKETVKETAPAPEWTESAVSGTRYVNTAGIYSRSKAQLGAPTVKQYNLNGKVTVVAVTNTDYYKLSDGNFIHKDYLGMDKVTVQTAKPSTTKPSTTAKPSASKPSTTAKPSTTKPASTTAKPNSWREGETEEHYNAALKVAKKIADEVRAEVGSKQSLKQIAVATDKVHEYYLKCSYNDTKVVNWSAWGVFIGKEASCAGATKALGMVLEQLGFEWEHMYEHSRGHQFCKVVNFSYNEEVVSLRTMVHGEFDENGEWYLAGGETLETGILKGNMPIYADADSAQAGFTENFRIVSCELQLSDDGKMIAGCCDFLNKDGTLAKGVFEWKHKDLSQYLS